MRLSELDKQLLIAIKNHSGLTPAGKASIAAIQGRLAKLKDVGLIIPSQDEKNYARPGYRYELTKLGDFFHSLATHNP